jgi:hypothetical protein
MDHVQSFRNHADECRRMARSTSDNQSRTTWNALAERWLHCADVAEHAMADAANIGSSYTRTRKMRDLSGSSGSDSPRTTPSAAASGFTGSAPGEYEERAAGELAERRASVIRSAKHETKRRRLGIHGKRPR